MTVPAVPPPTGASRRFIAVTLKPDWRFDARRRVFTSARGEAFSPLARLPEGSRIAWTVPRLARADVSTLSDEERELRRRMQIVLPDGASPARHVRRVRGWPCVAEAHAGPQVSLPRS